MVTNVVEGALQGNNCRVFIIRELLTKSLHRSYRQNRGDPVLHIDLRKWADIAVVAPLDANTLAKVPPYS